MADTTIRLELTPPLVTLWLQPPPSEGERSRPPTINLQVLHELDEALARVENLAAAGAAGPTTASRSHAATTDDESAPVRVLAIRSAHKRAFCAGGDIAALERLDQESMAGWIDAGQDAFDRLAALPLPSVAIVNGHALGGGLELALACDLIFATRDAKIGQTETRLGFVPGWGGSARLTARVGLACARELFFSARVLSGAQAAEIRLVDACGAEEEIVARLGSFTREVALTSVVACAELKWILGELTGRSARELEKRASVRLVRHPDTVRRVEEFLESRKRPR
mgnify:FL=1